LEELLRNAIRKFNDKAREDEKLKKDLEGVERRIQVEIEGGKRYHFILRNQQISDLGEGEIDSPNVRIVSDEATLTGLLKGEISPMKALATKKVRIKASLEDLFRLRRLF